MLASPGAHFKVWGKSQGNLFVVQCFKVSYLLKVAAWILLIGNDELDLLTKVLPTCLVVDFNFSFKT